MQITVTLTENQVKALKRLDLSDDAQVLAQKAVATAIRGKFNYFATKAEELNGKLYDNAIKHGAKFDKDKGAFVTGYMKEIRDIANDL